MEQDTIERIAQRLVERLEQHRALQAQHSREIGLLTHLDGRIAEIAQVLADIRTLTDGTGANDENSVVNP
jgi:hypothetical protein